MSSSKRKFIKDDDFSILSPNKIKIGIVVSDWNSNISNRLLKGAKSVLNKFRVPPENIIIKLFFSCTIDAL